MNRTQQQEKIATSTEPTTSTSGVTVIPNDSDPSEWIEDNPILATAIIIGAFLLISSVVILCWAYWKRKKAEKKKATTTDCEEGKEDSPDQDRRKSSASVFTDAFVIISNSPSMSRRRKSKPRRTLVGPPMFNINQRKPSGPAHNQMRRATVHFARWSEAGVEIHAAGELRENQNQRTWTSASAASGRNNSLTGEDNLEAPSRSRAPSISPGVPLVFRRVSQGHHHAIYAPESFKSNSNTLPADADK